MNRNFITKLTGVGLILLLFKIVQWWILIVIPAGTIAVLFPLMMRHGVKILNDERDSVYAQLSHNMPVKYKTDQKEKTKCLQTRNQSTSETKNVSSRRLVFRPIRSQPQASLTAQSASK